MYKARHRSIPRLVAIKILLDGPLASPQQRSRFAREIALTARLRHPNIVTLHETGVVRERQFFAMDYIDGVPIDDHCRVERPPVRECARLISQIGRAVSYAHQRGVLHRDLKPGNILVDSDDQPRILDFGLAKELNGSDGNSSVFLSTAGQAVGTLPYLSPEQAGGYDGETDTRSDVYALGVVLYRLLTGSFPYPVEGNAMSVRATIISDAPTPPRKMVQLTGESSRMTTGEIDDDLERIVLKALAKEKARRYQSANEFADDLDRFVAGEAVLAKSDSRLYVLRKAIRKNKAIALVSLAAVLVLIAASIVSITFAFEAQSEGDRARLAARQVHAGLDTMMTYIDEEIRPLAGGLAVRDRLLKTVAADLERVLPLVESDDALRDLRGTMYEKRGDIAYAEGRASAAETDYRLFLQASLEAAEWAPSPEERDRHAQNAARAHRKLGQVGKDTEAAFRQAIALGEELVQRRPGDASLEYDLGTSRFECAKWLYNAGRFSNAAELLDTALASCAPIAAVRTQEDRWQGLLARLYDWSGSTQIKLGNPEPGIERIGDALELLEALAFRRPADTEVRRDLLVSCTTVADIHWKQGRLAEARAMLDRAAEIGNDLRRLDPSNLIWQRELHNVYDLLTQLCLRVGQTDEAREFSEATLRIISALLASDPEHVEWRRRLGFAKLIAGQVALNLKNLEEAHQAFLESVQIREDLCDEAAGNDPALRKELARAYDWLGKCCRMRERMDEAISYLQASFEIREALRNEFPDVVEYEADVILSLIKIANWHVKRETIDDDQRAETLLRQAKAGLNTLLDSGRAEASRAKYQSWLAPIATNQTEINERAAQRAAAR